MGHVKYSQVDSLAYNTIYNEMTAFWEFFPLPWFKDFCNLGDNSQNMCFIIISSQSRINSEHVSVHQLCCHAPLL